MVTNRLFSKIIFMLNQGLSVLLDDFQFSFPHFGSSFGVIPPFPDHCSNSHYENMPMQYTDIFKIVKNENFQLKIFDIFLIFAQNIDCGYTLEPPRRGVLTRRGGSNEYPQSMFLSKNKKNRYTPAYPSFAI